MPDSTPKGYQYSLGTDSVATIDTTMQALAEKVDSAPGIAPLTTSQRNALTGGELWDGRVIWNASLGQLERYSVGSTKWLPIFSTGVTLRDTHSFTLQGEVRVDNAQNDFYIVPFTVEVPAGQTTTLRAINYRVLAGSVQFAIDRRTAAGATTRLGTWTAGTTYDRSTSGFPVALADRDTLHCIVLSATAGSKALMASLAYDMTV